MRFAWVSLLFILALSFVESAKAESVTDFITNSVNNASTHAGGIDFCGDLNRKELDAVECITKAFAGNRFDQSQFASLAEQLILNDMASDAHAVVKCHLPFLTAYDEQAKTGAYSGQPAILNKRAFDAYLDIQNDLKSASLLIAERRQKLAKDKLVCGEKPSSLCVKPYNDAAEADEQEILTLVAALTKKVPLGQMANVREGLLALATADIRDQQSFESAFSKHVRTVKKDLGAFSQELSDNKKLLDNGKAYTYDLNGMPSVREQLLMSDEYARRLDQLGAAPMVKQKLLCRRGTLKPGRERVMAGILGLSVISLGASSGLLAAGAGTGARFGTFMLQVGLTGADLTATAADFKNKCSDPPTVLVPDRENGTCSPEKGFDGLIESATLGQCLASVGTGLLSSLVAARSASKTINGIWRDGAAKELERINKLRLERVKVPGSSVEIARPVERTAYSKIDRALPDTTPAAVRKAAEAPFKTSFSVREDQITEIKDALMKLPANRREAAVKIVNKLHDPKEWSEYMQDLTEDALAVMKKSKNKKIREAADRGEVSRKAILNVIVAREKSRGVKEFTNTRAYLTTEQFKEKLPKPFLDINGGTLYTGSNLHGVDGHLIQRDFLARQANNEWPGGYQKLYDYMATDEGHVLWQNTLDFSNAANAGSPTFVVRLFNEAGLPVK